MIECQICLYNSNHPFGLGFNSKGICNGCLVHQEKFEINWNKRFDILKNIINKYKSKTNYDCIVPINGNIESFHILDIVINKLKLNPLGVHYNSGWNTEVGIKNLALLKNTFNFDVEQFNPNPNLLKEFVRNSISKFSSIYYPHLAGKYSYPVQVAIEHQVPLIIWGGHEGVEQTGMFSHYDYVEMSYRHFIDFHCMGVNIKEFTGPFETFSDLELRRFKYPEHKKVIQNRIRGIYLSNYTCWDPLLQNNLAVKKFKAYVAIHDRSFDNYEYIDCHHYMGVHDQIKFKKLGYSKVTDQINREIRFERINKKQAKEIVNYYSFIDDIKSNELFLNWINIKKREFNFILNDNLNQKWDQNFWKKDKLKKTKKSKKYISNFKNFELNKKLFVEKGENHKIIGKGV